MEPESAPANEFEFACPLCQRTLALPIGVAGKRTRCQVCGHAFTVPTFIATEQDQAGLYPATIWVLIVCGHVAAGTVLAIGVGVKYAAIAVGIIAALELIVWQRERASAATLAIILAAWKPIRWVGHGVGRVFSATGSGMATMLAPPRIPQPTLQCPHCAGQMIVSETGGMGNAGAFVVALGVIGSLVLCWCAWPIALVLLLLTVIAAAVAGKTQNVWMCTTCRSVIPRA